MCGCALVLQLMHGDAEVTAFWFLPCFTRRSCVLASPLLPSTSGDCAGSTLPAA
jgi:hypothetical protein